MSDPNENIPGRHRFGENCTPVTFREFLRDANWWLVGAIVFLLGFWIWVGYNVVEWVP